MKNIGGLNKFSAAANLTLSQHATRPHCRDGHVPPNALKTDNAIYVGKYEHCGSLIPGVDPMSI